MWCVRIFLDSNYNLQWWAPKTNNLEKKPLSISLSLFFPLSRNIPFIIYNTDTAQTVVEDDTKKTQLQPILIAIRLYDHIIHILSKTTTTNSLPIQNSKTPKPKSKVEALIRLYGVPFLQSWISHLRLQFPNLIIQNHHHHQPRKTHQDPTLWLQWYWGCHQWLLRPKAFRQRQPWLCLQSCTPWPSCCC